ncbi:protein DEK-like isoform X1 [Clavelina lepadiformis]|uniref:protein DEK-like isoform X1 n=1 Tax=Clavelina lepadiformis TaxID=159417 RepID=UPI0040410933
MSEEENRKEAEKILSLESEKKSSSEAEKKSSSEAEKKSSSEAEKKSSSETKKKPSLEAEKKPSSEAEKKPSSEAEKKPSSEAEKKPSSKAEKKPSSKAEKTPSPEAEKKPFPEAEKKLSPEAEKKPSSKAEKKPSSEAEKKPSSEAEKKPSPEAEKKPSPEAKETNPDAESEILETSVNGKEDKNDDEVKMDDEIEKETNSDAQTEKEELKEKSKDEDGSGSEEEELPPGLLERPVEILREKRERKKVTRFTYDDATTPTSDKKKKLEILDGRGVKLAEHPRVEWQLQRNKAEDLKIIHKLFFGSFGELFSCKKNIRNFSGFAFEKDSPEYEKKEDYIGRFTLDNLKWALTVCDVDNRKGKKEDLIDTLLNWCLRPKPSGKELPQKKKKREKKKKRRSGVQKSPQAVNNTSNSGGLETSDDEIASSNEDSNEEEESSRKVEKAKKTPKQKTPKSAEKKATKRKSKSAGRESPKKVAKIKIGSPKVVDNDDSEDSDTPLLKKKSPPTNSEIRKAVEKILKGADLEVITMKAVCVKVYSLYPDFDLSDRKAFIKETVKKIIS